MARVLVCFRARALLLALAAAPALPAAAEVNYALLAGYRTWEGDAAPLETHGGVGMLHQFDFGPAAWDWRPELGLTGATEVLDDRGQGELALGIARRWRADDAELRLSAGAVWLETHDGSREATVTGAYLQASVLWHLGERFALGLSARAGEVEDAVVGGARLPNDYRQVALALSWRFGD